MATGMIIGMVFASEAIDTTGEILDVNGCDISCLQSGDALANYEHRNGAKEDSPTTGQELVGRILGAKKIYGESDCDNDLEAAAWKKIKKPLIWGTVRLFDGAGHPGAQALAAQIRDSVANNEKIIVRASIEGHTITTEGKRLKESIAKKIAITTSPANKSCTTTLLSDPLAPQGFMKEPMAPKESDRVLDSLIAAHKSEIEQKYRRLGGYQDHEINVYDSINLHKAIKAIAKAKILIKTMTAGSTNAAPSTLSGGAALQREEIVGSKEHLKKQFKAALRDYSGNRFKKSEFKTFLKHYLPEVSEDYLNHFADAAEDMHVKNVRKTESLEFTGPPVRFLEKATIELRKALDGVPQDLVPDIYNVYLKKPTGLHRAGRVMLHNGQVQHLEDYYDIFNRIPQGDIDQKTASRIHELRTTPGVHVVHHQDDLGHEAPEGVTQPIDPPAPEEDRVEPAQAQPELDTSRNLPPGVFDYQRVGMDHPHTIEAYGAEVTIDGTPLRPEEVLLVIDNVRQGRATLRYRAKSAFNAVAKMERLFNNLLKADLTTQEAFNHLKSGVEAGHIHPDVEKAFRKLVYEDPMTPGMGNKYAATEFLNKNKPGVYISMDGNHFKHVNDTHGHLVGDEAIKTFGRAARESMDEAVGKEHGKLFRSPDEQALFRNGGDEFIAHMPSYGHAAAFARTLRSKLEALPPIAGTHKLSMSMGFGHNMESAEQALHHAKTAKVAHMTANNLPKESAPNMAHSLVPGYEGAVPLQEEKLPFVSPAPKVMDTTKPVIAPAPNPSLSAPPAPTASKPS